MKLKEEGVYLFMGKTNISLNSYNPLPSFSDHQSTLTFDIECFSDSSHYLEITITDQLDKQVKKVMWSAKKQPIHFRLSKGEKKVKVAAKTASGSELAAASTFIKVFPGVNIEIPLKLEPDSERYYKNTA